MVYDILSAADYRRYEISNFALAGHQSVHNMKYWSMLPYIGLGAGAHSMIYEGRQNGHLRWSHNPDLDAYIQTPLERLNKDVYTGAQSLKEAVVFGLRMQAGVDLKALESRYSTEMDGEMLRKITELADRALLERDKKVVRASQAGQKLLNSVMEYLW